MDKHQELRTNLVLQANSALSAIRELSDGLDKISKLKFDNVKSGFDSLTKAFEAAQKMSSKVIKTQTEDEKKFQNLLQQRAKIMKEMLDGYSKDRGFAKTERWDGLKSQFESANIEIANFMVRAGRAQEAVKYLQEALVAVANTPLYDGLKNQLARLKVDLKSVRDDVKDRVSELDGSKQAKETANQKKKQEELAKQQQAESEALQKYLGQKQSAYEKELKQEAELARTRKENENKRIEATQKRQEQNKKEWEAVQTELGKMERDPHRNDLYKTTGDYYPEMQRRIRLEREASEQATLLAQKEAKAKQAEIDREKELTKYLQEKKNLLADIGKYKGVDGQSLNKKGYDNMLGRINHLSERATNLDLHGEATLLNPSLLSGVNTKLGQFNSRLSEAKDKAQQLYMKFRETGSAVDKLNFNKAVNEMRRLERLSDDFNDKINRVSRSALTLGNILKRAREHFNWTAGAYVENAFLSFPSEMVQAVSKYELAMAGIAQVIPKAEEGQAQLNSLFTQFSDVASKYGQSVEDALESAKSIGRMYGQGDGDSDVGARNTRLLTEQAAKMATVDNFNMIDATKGLESALAQFNLQTEDTNLLMARSSKILDVWTKLAHSSGASAQDLTQGVNQAGASAKNAGVSFEFLNALIATGVRNTAKTGNEIGTTLKSFFASIQSDKAIKAMQDFGIQVYNIDEQGQRHLRPMKDLILDISRAIEATGKDTKGVNDFLLAISGGKFQVSKVAAILSNYKELLRTTKMASESAGFTDQQLEIQMNTVSRKFETLKANIDKLFYSSGESGLANDLKWLLDSLNHLIQGIQHSETGFYKLAKFGTAIFLAWKAIPAVMNSVTAALGRFSGAWEATALKPLGKSAGSKGGLSVVFETAKDSQYRKLSGEKLSPEKDLNTKAVDSNTKAIYGLTRAVESNTVQKASSEGTKGASFVGSVPQQGKLDTVTPANTSAIIAETNARRMRRLAVISETAPLQAYYRSMVRQRLVTVASTLSLNRYSGVMSRIPAITRAIAPACTMASVAFRGLGAAISALGGPLGAITLVFTAYSLISSAVAEAEGEKIDKINEGRESAESYLATVQQMLEKEQERVKQCNSLKDQYNALVDEENALKQAGDNSAESMERQNKISEEKKLIAETLASTLHANSIEFNEDGKINQQTIDNLAKADKEKTKAELANKKDLLIASNNATEALINDAQNQISAMKEVTGALWLEYQAWKMVFEAMTIAKKAKGFVMEQHVKSLKAELVTARTDTEKERLTKAIAEEEEAIYKNNEAIKWRDEHSGSDDYFSGEIAKKEAEVADLKLKLERGKELVGEIANAQLRLEGKGKGTGLDGKIDPTENNTNDERVNELTKGEIKENERAKKAVSEANKKRPFIYDEESKAFSTMATHIKQDYSSINLDVPTLQAIANALNGGSYAGVADPFHNGADNAWDSSYNFAEQLKKRFQDGKSLENALNEIFDGWGIVWDDVVQEQADALKKKYNYNTNKSEFEDPTEKNKPKTGSNLAMFDNLMSDNAYGHMSDALVGVNQCVTSSLRASALVSEWAQDMSNKGYAHVDRLYEEAVNDPRVTVKPYSDAEAKTGDIVLYVDVNGERQHAGVIAGRDENGNVINYDDSTSAGYRFIRRGVHDLGSNRVPAYLIHDNSVMEADGKPNSRWHRGGDTLQGFRHSSFAQFQHDQQLAREQYEETKKRLEIEEKLTGHTAEISQKIEANENLKLTSAQQATRVYGEIVKNAEEAIKKSIHESSAVSDAIPEGRTFFDLPDSEKQDIAKRAHDQDFEQNVKTYIDALKALKSAKLNEAELDFESKRRRGFLSTGEKEDYRIKQENDRYELRNDHGFENKWEKRKHYIALAKIYQEREERLAEELRVLEAKDEERKAELEQQIKDLGEKALLAQEKINELMENSAPSEEREEQIKNLTEKVKNLETQAREAKEELDGLNNYGGSEETRNKRDERTENNKKLESAQNEIDKFKNNIKNRIVDGTASMFTQMIVEGKSFKDAWHELWKGIAEAAIQELIRVFIIQKMIDALSSLGGHKDGGSVDAPVRGVPGPKALARGGSVRGFATGGYTDGLIQGAGTGTSDSILTYLAHRGEFIKTSNGEYIIQKKAVDKLGIGFLDMLNNNPDSLKALTGLKRYASGGNLGDSFSPSMSMKGIEGYKTFNKSNLEKQMSFSTRGMEALQRQTIDAIHDTAGGEKEVVQPIILNTQADSASVMKALQKNPRALQAILGNNQRRGFR